MALRNSTPSGTGEDGACGGVHRGVLAACEHDAVGHSVEHVLELVLLALAQRAFGEGR